MQKGPAVSRQAMVGSRRPPRLILIAQSFEPSVLEGLPAIETRRFGHTLVGGSEITIVEYDITSDNVLGVVRELALHIRSQRYYAHVALNEDELLVVFPSSVVFLRRGDAMSIGLARAVGERFGIPPDEMRFEEMFDTDHPDIESSRIQ